MTEDNSLAKYTKLAEDNFVDWNFQLQVYANSKDASTTLTTALDGTADADTIKKHKVIYTFIALTCSTNNQKYLHAVPVGNAFEAYQALATVYASKSQHSVFQLLGAVVKAQQNGVPPIEYTTRVSNDIQRLRTAITAEGYDIYDVLESSALISGADTTYSTTIEALLVSGSMSVSKVRKALIERGERLKIENLSDVSAMASTIKPRPTKPCPNCLQKKNKELYHWKEDCYDLHPEKRPQRYRNNNGRHTFQGASADASAVGSNDTTTTATAWPAAVVTTLVNNDNPIISAHVAASPNKLLAKVDSGAHGVDIFLSPTDTAGLHGVSNVNVNITQLGQDPVAATHQGLIGNVKGAPLRALTGAGISTTLLSVDGLTRRNIGVFFSGVRSGNQVLFVDEDRVDKQPDQLFPEGSIAHRGYKKGGEFLVELTIDTKHQPKLFEAKAAVVEPVPAAYRGVNLSHLSLEQRIYLLHCRMNHRSPEQLRELVENHSEGTPVEKGVPISTYQEATRHCGVCPLSKMKMRPHPHAEAGQPYKHTNKPYSFVHMDIKTMGNTSYGGSKYLCNVIDDATNALHPLPLKYKSDLTKALETFHRRHVKTLGLKIDNIKLDRAGEQKSLEFEDLCAKDSMLPHYTTTADSRANGKIERANHTISTDILSIRIQSGLPRKAWAELSRSTAIVSNLMPTNANPDKKSPHEMLNEYLKRTPTKPDLSRLRILGSKAFAYVNPKNRREGDNKSIEGVLVGYSDDLRTYRVMAKGSTTIIESDSVDIHETIPGHEAIVSAIRPRPDVITADDTTPLAPAAAAPQVPREHQPVIAAEPSDNDNRLRVPGNLVRFLDPELLAHADDIGEVDDDEDNDNVQAGKVHDDEGEQQELQRVPLPVMPGQAQLDASGIPVWRGRRVSTRSQSSDSLRSLPNTLQRGPPTAHFLKVVVPMVRQYHAIDDPVYNPTAHPSKISLTALPYSAAVKQPGSARGMLRELVNVVGERKLEIVKRPADATSPITSTWTHKPQKTWKLEGTEQPAEELRSRLCPRGYMQQPGSYNPDQIEAPTPRAETVKLFHALCVNRSQKVVLIDEKSAFSNTPLDPKDVIYMQFPDGMVNPNNEYILKMNNSINGIKQAANNYYRRTATHLMESEGFRRSSKDPCYFFTWFDTRFIQVLAWVDDLRVAGDEDNDVDAFVNRFKAKFPCKISDGTDYLGTEVVYDRAGGVLTISVKTKVEEVLKQFGMTNCRPVSTPAVPNTVLQRPEEEAVKDPEVETYDYLSGVYSVYWLALTGKQEILYAVRDLSLHTSNFDATHVQAFKHLLRYLQGQKDHHLTLRRGTPGKIITGAFADADFAGSPERSYTPMRSTSGIALYLVGIGMLLAICKGQPTIARSTAEAEYRSSGLASVVVLDMNDFLNEIGFPQSEPTVIHQDNHACIKMTKSLVCGSKSRHIKIEHHYIRELVANNQIVLVYCPTSEMVADLFTKNLAKPVFEYLRYKLYHLL